jgi:fumarate reductase flavoprotein subunit
VAENDVDVIVAGAGAAGCAAALTAAQAGRSVLLVERSRFHASSSNTAMSTAMIPAAGSRWQAEAGIDDSPDTFLDDIRRKTKGTADPVLATALTRAAPELVAWLADDCGVPLQLVTEFSYPGHSVPRCHAVADRAGATLLRHLMAAVRNEPGISLLMPARLDDVLTSDAGAVTGGVIADPGGQREEVSAGAVILATSGFAANLDLVQRYLPEIAGAVHHGSEESTGDALAIGERLGADTAFLDAYQGHGSLAVPHRVLVTWATVMHGGILVNIEGNRFGDETIGYSEYGARVNAQPEHTAWVVLDERIHEAVLPFRDYQDCVASGAIRRAADAAELAALIGCPVEVLARTLAAAHGAATGQRADALGRTAWSQPLRAPYVAVRVAGALFHTQGGLLVDGHGRVLRGGVAIPGLYAAGGAAHGISGHGADGYLAGNGLLPALGLGRLAAAYAAAALTA